MGRRSKPPRRSIPGIEIRHAPSCPARSDGPCRCEPTYRAWISQGRGKPRIRRTFESLEAARTWREDAKVDLRRGVMSAPQPVTVAMAAEAWIKGARSGAVRNRSGRVYKPSAIRGYQQALRDYVCPALGTTRLTDLKRGDVQRLADDLVDQGLSPSTVRNALLPLRAICRRALARGDIQANPTLGLELPAPGSGRDRIATAAEAARLIAALPLADQPIWATAFYAGLRLGELRALQWQDVDLARGVIRVRRNWDRHEGQIEPKSKAGVRAVPIPKVLRRHLERMDRGVDTALVFGRSARLPFSPSSIYVRAQRHWRAAGLEAIGLHECRHTFASLMIAAGVNIKALQTFMGHTSITVTMDRYGHLLPGSEDEAAALFDAYIAIAGDTDEGSGWGNLGATDVPAERFSAASSGLDTRDAA